MLPALWKSLPPPTAKLGLCWPREAQFWDPILLAGAFPLCLFLVTCPSWPRRLALSCRNVCMYQGSRLWLERAGLSWKNIALQQADERELSGQSEGALCWDPQVTWEVILLLSRFVSARTARTVLTTPAGFPLKTLASLPSVFCAVAKVNPSKDRCEWVKPLLKTLQWVPLLFF